MTFKPTFYWTGDPLEDAKRINDPHIAAEGPQEDRTAETLMLLCNLKDHNPFILQDALNIQNELLKVNNWKGIVPGLRTHNVNFKDTPDHSIIQEQIKFWFPIAGTDQQTLLHWYAAIQIIHPLSDLNGRVFGIIVSVLYGQSLK